MKILKNKTYNKLIEAYSPKNSQITYKEKCEILEKQLSEAKDLKNILERVMPNPLYAGKDGQILTYSSGGTLIWEELILPDNVLQYTDDILGGKVIKQEGVKCLVVDKNGNVKSGITKQKADKGFTYKLVRE